MGLAASVPRSILGLCGRLTHVHHLITTGRRRVKDMLTPSVIRRVQTCPTSPKLIPKIEDKHERVLDRFFERSTHMHAVASSSEHVAHLANRT